MNRSLLSFATTSAGAERVKAALPQEAAAYGEAVQTGNVEDLLAAIAARVPGLVVVDLGATAPQDIDRLAPVLAARPSMAVLLAGAPGSASFLLHAMRVGVRDVVPADSDADTLKAAVRRQLERLTTDAIGRSPGRVVAFVSAKGGSGATFLASSTAFALSARGRSVLLADLSLQFGDAALFVSQSPPATTIADAAREIDRLDPALLESTAMRVGERFWLLAAPPSAEKAIDVTPAAVGGILNAARARWDVTVVDLPSRLDAISIQALDRVDRVHVVMQQALPALHATARLVEALRTLGVSDDRIVLVINRHEKAAALGVDTIEKTLGLKTSAFVPNSWRVVDWCVTHGISVLDHAPKDPITKAMTDIADSILPPLAVAPVERRTSWLRSLVGAS